MPEAGARCRESATSAQENRVKSQTLCGSRGSDIGIDHLPPTRQSLSALDETFTWDDPRSGGCA
jgi:hypothetical protein